jgi:hypothetical protein
VEVTGASFFIQRLQTVTVALRNKPAGDRGRAVDESGVSTRAL